MYGLVIHEEPLGPVKFVILSPDSFNREKAGSVTPYVFYRDDYNQWERKFHEELIKKKNELMTDCQISKVSG